ncbi:hypothetical protein Cni_G09368 [Canna indica]|uniref:Uncharacterized protein n=1 Tax=Canna indica TaxID=4628 RepID=A0AAQ3K268_9LILI|nr:hypothetical protein Cni_G09368 [Canna indica]
MAPNPSSLRWVASRSYADAVRSDLPASSHVVALSPSAPRFPPPGRPARPFSPALDPQPYLSLMRKSGRCFNYCARGHRIFECCSTPACFHCRRRGHCADACSFFPSHDGSPPVSRCQPPPPVGSMVASSGPSSGSLASSGVSPAPPVPMRVASSSDSRGRGHADGINRPSSFFLPLAGLLIEWVIYPIDVSWSPLRGLWT